MAKDQGNLERFLNSLDGEVVAITPNVKMVFFWMHRVDFLFITERIEGQFPNWPTLPLQVTRPPSSN
jgi:hypothetical protein